LAGGTEQVDFDGVLQFPDAAEVPQGELLALFFEEVGINRITPYVVSYVELA
jgi:hypothetical protein